MRVADRRLWAVQQALGRTVVVKSRSASLFYSSHFTWEPAEGLEMFRYVSSICRRCLRNLYCSHRGLARPALHSACAKACFISIEVSSQPLVLVRGEQAH